MIEYSTYENSLTPLEIYMNKVFRFLIAIIPSIALCAGLTFTMLHVLGYYPEVRISTMVIFDVACVIYTGIGLIFNRTCQDKSGHLKPGILIKGKIFITLMMLIQWNFISYMIPSRDFWAYSFFFVLLAMAFLDSRFILIIISGITGSMLLSWLVRPDQLLPVRDELFVPEMVLRFVVIVLCFATIWSLTFIIEQRLAKELEKISDFDTLTHLYNRRKLDKYLESAIEKGKEGNSFSIIMADIDDFKKVNDTYGHSCGDEVLKDVANIVGVVSDNRSSVFRYGGEEILILMYDDLDAACSVAEDIRKRVSAHETVYEGVRINVTLTQGVAVYSEADTRESIIKRADTNLYYGKAHGKNCVIA